MEGELATIGAAFDNGAGAVFGQVLWQKVCILGYGEVSHSTHIWSVANITLRLGQIHGVEIPSQC